MADTEVSVPAKVPSSNSAAAVAFKAHQRSFLTVYLIMMAADWMQGPYVYKLYEYYGFSREENGQLFIAGFASSMVFGTVAGSLCDKYGRKFGCIMYGLIYIASCLTKNFASFKILMIGRILGGLATSLLLSVFESWMVSEHNHRNFPEELLSSTFSYMTMGNGIVAILSGWVAQAAVVQMDHPVAPFYVSACFLFVGTVFIWMTWTENYGDQSVDVSKTFNEGIRVLKTDRNVLYLGVIQSLFEASMYTFVFMWTPALEAGGEDIPHGAIFAFFMISCSVGGALFNRLAKLDMPLENQMVYVFVLAGVGLSAPIFSTDTRVVCLGFLLFEVAVGMFWPGMGTLRGKYVPEHCRSTIMNLFRVPLNFIVCMILFYVGTLTTAQVFSMCCACLVLAATLQTSLANRIK